MRIAFVLPDFRCGGAENVIISIANNISNRNNFEVYLFVGKNVGPLKENISKKITLIELGGRSGFKNAFKIKKNSHKYDIDSIVGTLGMAHSVALSKLIGCKAFCVSRIGNTISEDLKRWTGIKKILMYVYQNVLVLSDAVVTQSKFMTCDFQKNVKLLKLIRKEQYQIYNPIDFQMIHNKSLENIDASVSSDDLVTVGRLERQKNVSTILKAFSLYSKNFPNAKLHILGDGKERAFLEKECEHMDIKNEVIFHGVVKNPYPYILKSKCFIMSSLYEGFSNAILEAAALNTKILVTDCPGGNREIISHNINGKLYPVMDYETLYHELKYIDEFIPEFTGLEKFDLNTIVDEYLNVICRK